MDKARADLSIYRLENVRYFYEQVENFVVKTIREDRSFKEKTRK